MPRLIHAAIAAALIAAPAAAQTDPTPVAMPDGWMARLDRPGEASAVSFTTMPPGWHVATAGRGAGIFWQPAMTVSGEYRLSSTIHLMKPAQHAEAFGLFVGGRDLEGEDQAYLYFLVRQTGEYLIKRRRGDGTEDVVGWTAHRVIPTAAEGRPTRYDLTIQVGERTVDFLVNGATVRTVPRSQLETDGIAGLRINHLLDIHVETLELTGTMLQPM